MNSSIGNNTHPVGSDGGLLPDSVTIFQTFLTCFQLYMNVYNITNEAHERINNEFIRKPHPYESKSFNNTFHGFAATFDEILDGDWRYLCMNYEWLDNENQNDCDNTNLDEKQNEMIENVSYWLQEVATLIIGTIGVLSNLVAIPILCQQSMKSIFNRLLISLLALHTIYLIGVILTQVMWSDWDQHPKGWLLILFSFVLHPLEPIMLYSSTFITTLLARQRYLAIRHPIEYRNSTLTVNPCTYALKVLASTLVVSGLFALPMFFEATVAYIKVGKIEGYNVTHFQYVVTHQPSPKIHWIRFNNHYVLWYRNVAVLIVSLIIPLVLLAYWNFNTLLVIMRRRRLRNRPSSSGSLNVIRKADITVNEGGNIDKLIKLSTSSSVQTMTNTATTGQLRTDLKSHQAKREESRKAQVLFAIVIIFVVCNVPRTILNMEELSAIAPSYWKSLNPISKDNSPEHAFETFDAIKCYSAPFWAHILRSISKLLLTLNASVGCFVYCMICSRFRNEMSSGFTKIISYIKKIFRTN